MASLETVSEIVKRIEDKIDQLNGSVKSLGDWRIVHQEETKAQNEKIRSLLRVVAVLAASIPFMLTEVRQYAGAVLRAFIGI